MPTINRKPIQPPKVEYKKESKVHAQEFYNSLAWKRLRDTYLKTHAICECCLEHGRVIPATDIHHKVPWDRGKTEEEKWQLFLNEKNLLSVCETCHHALHFKDKQYHLSSLDSLTDTEYRYAHGLNFLK